MVLGKAMQAMSICANQNIESVEMCSQTSSIGVSFPRTDFVSYIPEIAVDLLSIESGCNCRVSHTVVSGVDVRRCSIFCTDFITSMPLLYWYEY